MGSTNRRELINQSNINFNQIGDEKNSADILNPRLRGLSFETDLITRLVSATFFFAFFILAPLSCAAQTYFTPGTSSSNNYLKSSVFRQEIAKFEINVVRDGKAPLPITQVPRIQQGDVLKVKLLDEAVNGIKLDQSNWDWTFLVAFINPSHRMTESNTGKALIGGKNNSNKTGTVSEEINFRKTGWYKEYSFTVPYDSQPVFFLYPRAKYRKQLMKVVTGKYEEIRKLGEKTIELADAYSQIDTFLNELQLVLNRNAQLYGYGYGTNGNTNTSVSGSPVYNPYSSYSTTNPYSTTYPYGTTTTNTTITPLVPTVPLFGLQPIPALNQIVEGLAKSFNIQLPSCWGNGSSYGNSYGSNYSSSSYNSYTPSYSSGYSSGYSSYGNNNQVMDFVSRAQCVAKQVNLQDFDISVTRMWQQGGVFLAAELQRKYPQIAYWINIAAAAIDFIVKAFQKSPLRIVPSIIQTSDGQQIGNGSTGGNSYGNTGTGSYNQYSSSGYNQYSTPNSGNFVNSANSVNSPSVKISLFADSQPAEGQFVTAYPIIVHKWQANPDPEVISLNSPILSEPCLHSGTNLLKSTDLTDQWSQDTYSRDFRLVMTSTNGFKKEFPLRKNIGLGGWELNITSEDLAAIPKINMSLESELVGMRGFNEIRSPKFSLPLPLGGSWEITPESQKAFVVGGKRTITLRNSLGSCRCLQRVIYKPSFGGQFIYEANNQNNQNNLSYSSDGKEVSFEIDATNFQPGTGTLEVKTYSVDNQSSQMNQPSAPQASGNSLNLKLYPAPPSITDVKVRRGDREILITGERLDQLQSITINGKRAIVKGNNAGQGQNQVGNIATGQSGSTNQYPINNSYPNQNQGAYLNQSPVNTTAAVPPVSTSPAGSSSPAVLQPPSQYRNLSPNQRVAVFEDTNTKINADNVSLELNLEDNRTFTYPQRFTAGASRPAIKANELNEIEGVFLNNQINGNAAVVNSSVNTTSVNITSANHPNQKPKSKNEIPQFDISKYPIVSIDRQGMTLTVQNTLTDYDFKLENLSIETGIENSTSAPNQLPTVTFDVLDTNNLRLNFAFNEQTNKYLSGRRLQFRIRDKERGDSDWYTIKQTFVRVPSIESVKCTNEMNNQCEMKGEGLDYIAQVSTDGGRSWYPQASNNPLQVQPTEDGKLMTLIPLLLNKKFLQIKLRDYPNTDGLTISDFVFSNTVRKPANNKANQPAKPNQLSNQSPTGNLNQLNQNPAQNIKPNQPGMNKSRAGKLQKKSKQ